MRRVSLAGLALVGALLLAIPSAFAKSDGTAAAPGITARTITIGGSFPLTGPASSYAPIPVSMKAYFSYINARRGPDGKRGVYGRQIVFKYYDDGYNPVNSVQQQRRLVEQDRVFAIVATLGTEVNQAVQPYLNSRGVPHVLVSTGASEFGLDYKKYPWTIGWQPDYVSEGRLYGVDIRRNKSNAKIAILYQNDSYGRDYVRGFKAALGTANVRRQV
ncbi:MAG TPA: ABC transporter substrate-binding protein, partial [Gaiellaceae bacterium]|nr:ABC transporter substrate-binding protein [Gaiellaceae bacterium]